MASTIETDLQEILGQFKQEFTKINQRLDKIENDLTSLKIEAATAKVDLNIIKEDVRKLRGSQLSQIWALIGIIFSVVVGVFIKFSLIFQSLKHGLGIVDA